MKLTVHQSKIRTIRQGDPLFTIVDGFVTANRAGFEIGLRCPDEYRSILIQAIDYGWIKPVAYMTAEEQFIETLKL